MSNIPEIDVWGIPLTEHHLFSGAFTSRKYFSMHQELVNDTIRTETLQELKVVNRWLVLH